MSNFTADYIQEAIAILIRLDQDAIERTADLVNKVRAEDGRIFFLGVGGGAGHASHAVCDFRKIALVEAYAPSDNVSELTARTNDDGWDSVYANWLRGSHLRASDLIFVFSVGGGDEDRHISTNLVRALQYAKHVGARICGVVGRDGGFTKKVADVCVLIPVMNPGTVTPQTESFQAVIWHMPAAHPKLKMSQMKWESVH